MVTLTDPQRWQQLSDLFDELIDLPEPAREQRLDALRLQQPALVDALSKMLIADAHEGVLDRSRADWLTGPDQEPALAFSDRSGERVGPYQLLKPLGRGGMGEVYLAERVGADFEQRVAIKLLKRGMDSAGILQRFARERRILAQLVHPHIARLLDGGIADDGTPYFAMEYIDGVSLSDYARARRLDPRQRVQLLLQAVDAVAYAQSRLVVHRDIKPSNLLVDNDGGVRVLDFGIAKLLDDDDDQLTGTGAGVMSPAYAAPEQVRGDVVTTATDVYALGGVLFDLLTGQPPHPERSGPPLAWMPALAYETLERPSQVLQRLALAELGSEYGATSRDRLIRALRGDLDRLVAKALHVEPSRRYPTAAAFAADLRNYLEARPIRARPDTARYRLRKFVARHRLGVGSASAVLLALIAGLGLALWQAGVARDQAAVARMEAERAERQTAVASEATERAKRVKDFMMQTFVQADPLRRDADAPKTVAEAFDDALARVDTELADDPILQVDVLDDFSEIRAGQGRFEEASVLVNRALALAEKTYPPDHPTIAESLVNRSVISNYGGGDPQQATRDLERAVAILEAYADSDPLNLANALSALSAARSQAGLRAEVLALSERTLALWRQHHKPGDEGLAAALHNNASALIDMGRFAEAEPLSREAIDEMTALGGPDTPRLVPLLAALSQIHYRRGDMDAAAATNKRRLELVQKAFSGPHPWTAAVLADIGQQLSESQPQQAAHYLDQSIAMFTELHSARVLAPLRYRALLARDSVGDAEARRYFDQGLAICRQQSLDHMLCDLIRANRAGVIARMGDGRLALAEVDAAMASIRTRSAGVGNEYAQALESKALAQFALHQTDAAIRTQQQAIDHYIALFGADHQEVARARNSLQNLQ